MQTSAKKPGTIAPSQNTSLPERLDAGELDLRSIIFQERKKVSKLGVLKSIIDGLNRSDLGCEVYLSERRTKTKYDYYDRRLGKVLVGSDIEGVSRDGKAVFIVVKTSTTKGFFDKKEKAKIPQGKRNFLQRMALKNALVGVAFNYSDAYDIISNSPDRLKRTFSYLTKEKNENG